MKFHSYPAAHTILQKLSLISNLLKWIGFSDSGAVDNASMMRCITVPTCSSASAGAVYSVASFTDGVSQPVNFNANDRSKIALYLLLLCGIIANGENFKFDGEFCFVSSNLTMVEKPHAAFCRALTWICEVASYFNADEWGILFTAASILSVSQSRPTKTGHTTRAYYSNKCSSGCCLALHLGNTRPRNFPLMNTSGPVNSPSNRCW